MIHLSLKMIRLVLPVCVLALAACARLPIEDSPGDPDYAPLSATSPVPDFRNPGAIQYARFGSSLFSDRRATQVGDIITITGLATANMSYTVVKNDLSADGKGGSKNGSADEINANVAAQVRKAINNAAGSLALAAGNGSVVTLNANGQTKEFTVMSGSMNEKVQMLQVCSFQSY